MAKLSTRKRGKKNPTWYYSFDAGIMPDGKRKRIEKGGFATEKEARNAGTKAMASFLKGNIALISEKISVHDFLEEWLERKSMEVRPMTLHHYRGNAKRIERILGDKQLQKLRPRDVDDTMRQLAKEGLSHGTLSVTLSTLKEALSYAVYPAELISANPAQNIKVPRNTPRKIVARHVIREAKLSELLDDFPFGHPLHMPIMIAYHTGMRIGEILGLAWDCIDMETGVVSVKRQLTYVPETGYMFGLPKTQSSIRDIKIGAGLLSLLRRWKSQQAANEVKHGGAYFYAYEAKDGGLWQMHKQIQTEKGMTHHALVCTNENGKTVCRNTFVYQLHIRGINSHSFRHTHATVCAENGAPPKGLAGRLGHSTTNITENLYTHETEEIQKSTLEAFERNTGKGVL